MTSFGLERKGFELFGDILVFKCKEEDPDWLLLHRRIPTGG